MKKLFLGALLLSALSVYSQKPDSVKSESWKTFYRSSATKINDLVNTKLDISFDFSKSWMYGKAWITLHPHFYPTDSLKLDAKSMNINEVSIVKAGKSYPLKYRYDSLNLFIGQAGPETCVLYRYDGISSYTNLVRFMFSFSE